MENSEHSIAHEAAGSSPAEAGCGEDILDLVCTLFWPVSNQKVSEAYQFNNNICFDWVIVDIQLTVTVLLSSYDFWANFLSPQSFLIKFAMI